jgi:hypothetical protein
MSFRHLGSPLNKRTGGQIMRGEKARWWCIQVAESKDVLTFRKRIVLKTLAYVRAL